MFFDGWSDLARTLIVGSLAYAALIFWLRLTGKRTLSKWNAFDLIVTIALGSTLATVLLSKDVALAEGALALGLLVTLQFVITWSSVRSRTVHRIVKAEPTLLFHRGKLLQDALRAERVAESEVRAAIRSAGIAALEDIEAVVLETDGNFSVINRSASGSRSSLQDVKTPERAAG